MARQVAMGGRSQSSGIAGSLLTWGFILERVTRIELALSTWE
jgi:hypothetical protein